MPDSETVNGHPRPRVTVATSVGRASQPPRVAALAAPPAVVPWGLELLYELLHRRLLQARAVDGVARYLSAADIVAAGPLCQSSSILLRRQFQLCFTTSLVRVIRALVSLFEEHVVAEGSRFAKTAESDWTVCHGLGRVDQNPNPKPRTTPNQKPKGSQ